MKIKERLAEIDELIAERTFSGIIASGDDKVKYLRSLVEAYRNVAIDQVSLQTPYTGETIDRMAAKELIKIEKEKGA